MTDHLVGRWFRHFKGTNYMVVGVARSCEDGSDVVIYASQDNPHETWVRSKEEFLDIHPSGVRRFSPIPYDEHGPTEPVSVVEFRKETEVVAFQIFEGSLDIERPLFTPLERGELPPRKIKIGRQDFHLNIFRASRTNMSENFFNEEFEIRYSDDAGRMIRLKNCVAVEEQDGSIRGTYDFDASEFEA